jgi:mannose-1-phosphate guanylyltransferase/phosphomannomutase
MRLRPLTCDLPKPLLPVLNRPIAEHALAWLRGHGLTALIMTLHYLPDTVQSYFQDGRDFGVQVSYAVEELRPLGTAGCVRQVAALLPETFVVVSGDVNLQAAIGFHRERGAKMTVILTQVPDPGEFRW